MFNLVYPKELKEEMEAFERLREYVRYLDGLTTTPAGGLADKKTYDTRGYVPHPDLNSLLPNEKPSEHKNKQKTE